MLHGLYVHVPYCETKCGYCDFYSVPLADHRTSPLITALIRELRCRLPAIGRVDTVFVGGGTPTVLPLDEFTRLFQAISEACSDSPPVEFTTEANPATVDPERIGILVDCGVRRISFGGQSLNADELKTLERLHDPADIEPGIRMARAGGMAEVNLDLIFGIPGQTLASWADTLRRAIDFGTDHLSCYGLTYEPGTPMTARAHAGALQPCDSDLEADMYLMTLDMLAAAGFEQYEISNFAQPGRACRHNMVYWSNWPYLGIGPSAASYIKGVRFKNVAHIETYMRDIARDGDAGRDHECVSGSALADETVMLQLRLNRGIDIAAFERQVGIDPLRLYGERIDGFVGDGLIACDDTTIRLTRSGRLVADYVIRSLMATPSDAAITGST